MTSTLTLDFDPADQDQTRTLPRATSGLLGWSESVRVRETLPGLWLTRLSSNVAPIKMSCVHIAIQKRWGVDVVLRIMIMGQKMSEPKSVVR